MALLTLGCARRSPTTPPENSAAWDELHRMVDARIRAFHAAAIDHLLPDRSHGSVLLAEYAVVEEWTLHDGKCTYDRCPEGRLRRSTDKAPFRFDWPPGVPIYLAVRSHAFIRDRSGRAAEAYGSQFGAPACGTFTKGVDGRWKLVEWNDRYREHKLERYWER